MSATLISGKQVSSEIRAELANEIAQLKAEHQLIPGLAVILVGEDPASQSYVTAKEKACGEIGIASSDYRLPSTTTEEELLTLIAQLNQDVRIHGILVQLPLPQHIDENKIIMAISPDKDVDGFHPVNVGRLVIGQKAFLPCTPHGIVQMIVRNNISLDGAHIVIIGRSNIVGKPLANLLIQKSPMGNATVTLCHTHTPDIGHYTRQADIVIAATGHPHTLTADMIRPGAVVIDVGVNRIPAPELPKGYRLVGDVDFDTVKEKASFITPVPGGVGPMTITMLLYNTVESAKNSLK